MLTERQINIIVFLINAGDWVKGEELSAYFHLNKKTIQLEIKQITESLIDDVLIKSSNNKGYYIEYISENAISLIQKDINIRAGKNSLSPRHSTFVLYLLFLKTYITLQDLADIFYMSKTAAALEIDIIKRWLKRYKGISLEVSNKHGIRIHASEFKKRVYCSKQGTIVAFKSLPFPEDLKIEYVKYFNSVKEILSQSCYEFNYIITGEELEKNTRFIASTILRSRMGYKREENEEEEVRTPLLYNVSAQIEDRLGYRLTRRELNDIEFILSESSTISLPDNLSVEMNMKIDQFMQRVSETSGVNSEELEVDYVMLGSHIEKMALRANSGDIAINHYNEEIILQYPLETYLTYRFFPKVFSVEISKETSFIALFLSTYFNQSKDKYSVLLVSDQNISVGHSIRSILQSYEFMNIEEFRMMPTYQYGLNPEAPSSFDILLTTNPEVILSNHSFFLISPILKTSDMKYMRMYIQAQIEHIIKQKKDIMIREYVKEFDVSKDDNHYMHIKRLLQQQQELSFHTFSEKNLYIGHISEQDSTQITIYNLKEPILFHYKKIRRIINVKFHKGEKDLFPFFNVVSDILNSYK